MALYHLSVSIISRSSSAASACAAAAYRSGEKITNELTGITYDYRKKQNVEFSTVILPENAPAALSDRSALWNAVEKSEKQVNSQLARDIEFSLPRELEPALRQKIALEFVTEQFVSKGMIADVAFHNPPKMNSHKQPIDASGNVTNDPKKFIYDNPHCHVLCTMRPIDENGNWEPKKTKLYVCEKNGKQDVLTPERFEKEPGWEKIYHFENPLGKKSWHTKSYVESHPDKKLIMVSRYPKCEQAINPKLEEWNSKEILLKWREAWAEKVNAAYEAMQINESVDHRSYKDQGVDLLPTIHEGKAITIEEKRLKEEYERKLARGEEAILKHTEVRDLNNAIREHNREIKIIEEVKKLRAQLEKIVEPVIKRIQNVGQSIAEKLERLRIDIVELSVRIKQAIEIKSHADTKIQMERDYLKDLAPIRSERLNQLQNDYAEIQKLLSSKRLRAQQKEDLASREKILSYEITCQNENIKYASDAEKEINRLQKISEQTGITIEQLKTEVYEKETAYRDTESQISPDSRNIVTKERMVLRPTIEAELHVDNNALFQHEAQIADSKLNCAYPKTNERIHNEIEHLTLN